MRRRFLLATPLALAACSAPVVHEYRLAAVPGRTFGGNGKRIVVRNIGVPGDLSGTGLPQPGGPYMANSFANDVWAAPLPGMLQQTMVQDLAQRLPGDIVLASTGAIGAAADMYVEINVLAFSPDETGKITLQAQLSTRPAANQDWRLRNFTASAPGGALPDGIAAAMSTLWGQAADAVAAMI